MPRDSAGRLAAKARTLLRLREGEEYRTLVLFLMNFCVVAFTIAGKSARDTYFLSRHEKQYLPLMFVACAVAVALASSVYARSARRLSKKRLFDITVAVSACLLVAMQTRMEGWVIPALYVWVDVIVTMISFQVWLEAARLFDPRQARRVLALIGAGGSLAAIVAGSSLRPFVRMFGAGAILPMVIGILGLYWIVGRLAMRCSGSAAAVSTSHPAMDQKRILGDRYLISIGLAVALSAMVTQVVDYQFKMIASRAFPDETALAGFFGGFYALTGAATLVMQFFATGPLLGRFGLLAGLLALPLSLGWSTIGLMLNPRLGSAVLTRFADQTLKFTLHNSSVELLWLPVPPERRNAARPLISGALKASAEGFAGLLVFLLMPVVSLERLGLVTLGAVTLWTLTALQTKNLYRRALAAAIEKRQIDFENLPVEVQDAEMVSIIDRTLRSGSEASQMFALELVEGLRLTPWARTLCDIYPRATAAVQSQILSLTADEPSVLPDQIVLSALSESEPVAIEAIRAAGRRNLSSAALRLEHFLDDASPAKAAAAAAALLAMNGGAAQRAQEVLSSLLGRENPESRVAALRSLAATPQLVPEAELTALLADASASVREAALEVAAAAGNPNVLPALVNNLGDPRTAGTARFALAAFPEQSVVAYCCDVLTDVKAPRPLRAGVARALARFPDDQSAEALTRSIRATDPEVSNACAGSLLAIRRTRPLGRRHADRLLEKTRELLREAYRGNRMLLLLDPSPGNYLLREHYEQLVRALVPVLLKIGAQRAPEAPIELCVRIIEGDDPTRLPLVHEYLDEMFTQTGENPVLPLVERRSAEERDVTGRRLFPDLPEDPVAEVKRLSAQYESWEGLAAGYYLCRGSNGPDLTNEDCSNRKWGEHGSLEAMYSTLEKTILLKSVSLFHAIPAEKLSRIARISKEVRRAAGELVVKEGDPGDSLFVIVDGRVRVHKGETELAALTQGESLGEMALLDQSTRSASATVVEDATLLEIGQQDFYEVMAASPEIMRSIIALLCRRLREANERILRSQTR